MKPDTRLIYGFFIHTAAILLLLLVPNSSQSTVLLHLKEDRIVNHNNSAFVSQVMRLAKAGEMMNYMNEEVEPCENFFEFACGNWPKINPAQSMTPRETNFFDMLTNAYVHKQAKVLKEGKHKKDTAVDAMVKDFYMACMNIKRTKASYSAKLRQFIEEFGQMPVLVGSKWNESEFDWLATIAQIQHQVGQDIILGLGIRQDFEDTNVNKLFVGQPVLRLQSKSMYMDEATKWHRDYYRQEIAKNLEQHLGVSGEQAKLTAAEILDFEVQLAKGIADRKLGLSLKSVTKLRTLEELSAIYEPSIDFKRYITLSLGHKLNDTLYEFLDEYQINLVHVLKETSRKQLANYILYQLAHIFFVDATETTPAREKKCLGKTKICFAKVLDNMIFRRYNNNDTQRDINLIWRELKSTFKAELETSAKLDWMTLMTRKLAAEKLEAMQLEINSYVKANFSEEFAALPTTIDNKDYLQNLRAVIEFETRRAIASLYEKPKPVDAAVLFSYSPAHIASENLIKIPVSLLQPNFLWSDNYPHALKFGTLGYLVAHELIHGFDDVGRNFDVSGKEQTWWDTRSIEAFNERKQCFKQQYARFRYGGKYLPESEQQAENIADNGAVKVAYAAYTNWLQSLDAAKSTKDEHEAKKAGNAESATHGSDAKHEIY